MQICTWPQTDNHASTSTLSFFTGQRPFEGSEIIRVFNRPHSDKLQLMMANSDDGEHLRSAISSSPFPLSVTRQLKLLPLRPGTVCFSQCITLAVFRAHLETYLFLPSFPWLLSAHTMILAISYMLIFTIMLKKKLTVLLLLLQPFYGPLDCVRDYPGEPVPER